MRVKREDGANGNAGRQSPICTRVQKAKEKGKNRCSRISSRVCVQRMEDRNDAHRWKIDSPYPRIPKPIRIIADRTIHIIAPCSRSHALSLSLSLPFFFFSSPVYAIHQESNFRSSTVVCNRAWNNVAQSFKNARYSFYYIKALVYQMLLRNNVNWDLLYQFLGKF